VPSLTTHRFDPLGRPPACYSQEATAEIEERRGEAGDSSKYEMLFKRDQEMTEFIDRFNEMRDRESAERKRMQDTIVGLLEHISESMDREKR
jgi:phage regulator Rha-like protein